MIELKAVIESEGDRISKRHLYLDIVSQEEYE